ncbi:S-layer homology domain-containing protein [Candidatus Dojkabacteria bacterium]|nr:S-layer homology domain-containing protein [Candidatus Dojkabacteria bacterium]
MKKSLQFFILVAFVSIFIPTKVSAAFPDVAVSNEFYTAVEYVQTNNIVNGYSDGTYQPARIITRGEFTKILINSRFTQDVIAACTDLVFPDVREDNSFKNYICVANKNSIVSGYSDGSYKPDTYISIGGAAKIIANSFSLNPDLTLIDDLNKFRPYVNRLAEKNVIPTTIVNIDSQVNRGEMAEMIYRLVANITNKASKNYADLGGTPNPTPTPTPTPRPTPKPTPWPTSRAS